MRRVALLFSIATVAFAVAATAQTPPAGSPQPPPMPTWQKVVGGIMLVGGIGGVWGVFWLRRYLRDGSDVGDLTLADIRKMRDDGQITSVEYDAMRDMLVKREKERLEADAAAKEASK
jgi:hypothetical protein